MGVFGIVALMLVLGLTATNAFAQVSKVFSITTPATGTTVAATATTDVVFEVVVGGQVDAGANNNPPQTPASTVTITIPHEWPTQPVESDDPATADAAGEVTFARTTAGTTGRAVGRVSGRSLIIDIGKGLAGNDTYTVTYNDAAAPARRGTYRFPVSGATLTTTGTTTVDVGYAPSGTGTIALTSHTPLNVKVGTVDHVWNKRYILTSEQDLGEVRLTYTAAGSMPKGTEIDIACNGFTIADLATKLTSEVATASGSGSPKPSVTTTTPMTVTATIDSDGGLEKGNQVHIVIKLLKAPAVTTAPTVSGLDLTVTSTVPDSIGGDPADLKKPDGTSAATGAVFEFRVSMKPGTGSLGITSEPVLTPALAPNTAVVAGTDLGTLTFGITGTGASGPDAKFQIKVPDAFPAPITAPTTIGGDPRTTDAGHTNNGKPNSGARTISGDLKNNESPDGVATTTLDDIEYRVGKIETQGRHMFGLSTSGGPHTTLTARTGGEANDVHPRYIDVTAKHDAGTYTVYKADGTEFSENAPAQVHDLELVYRAGGYMPSGSVTFWRPIPTALPITDTSAATDGVGPTFRNDNGDGVDQAGEVTANVPITVTATTVTATGNWNSGTEIRVKFKDYKVPGEANAAPVEYTFRAKVRSFGTGTDNLVNEDYKVGAGRTADGSGSIAILPVSANSNTMTDLTVTFTPAGLMKDGSQVKLILPPAPWPRLNAAGTSIEVMGGSSTSDANSITATTVLDVGADQPTKTIVFNIKGVTTPTEGGPYEFTAQSKAVPGGALKALSDGAAITINQVTAGTAALSTTSAEPGAFLDDLMITFTAGARMAIGSKVTVRIPAAFTSVRPDNNDGVDDAGEVTLAGSATLGVSGGGGTTPWVLTATTNAVIESGGTLVFTYKDVTAPTAEDVYEFRTEASVVSNQGLLPLASQPALTVRNTVDGLDITADATTVFTDEDITLTISLMSGTETGRALGNLSVALSAGDAGGTFTPASATIADNTSEVSVTYSNDTAGMATLTATIASLNLTDSVDVEVKSTITDLMVNAEDEPEPVEVGSTITVSATGVDGRATVSVMDADDDPVESLSNLGLDGAAPGDDGSVAYSRDINLPDDLDEGMYTVTVTIAGKTAEVEIEVVAAREAVTELTLTPSADSFFAEESITVTVASDARAPVGGLEVTLSTDPEDSGMFSMTEGGDAISTVMIEDSADTMSAMVYYTNDASGEVTLMAAAGDLEASAAVTVKPSITVQVNGMDAPEGVQAGDTLAVTATGKPGGGTVMVTDAEGEAVGSLTGLGLNVDADGNYMRDVVLPDDLDDGTYTVTVTIGSQSATVDFTIATPPPPVDGIAVAASPTSVFVGEEVTLNITLWSGSDAANAMGDMVVMLSSSSETSTLAESVTIADGENGVETTFSDSSGGMVTITATSGDLSGEAIVEVKPTIINFQVNGMDDPGPLTAGVTITVTATGKEGKATASVTDAEGVAVVPSAGLHGLDEEPDDEGNIDYTRDIDLPDSLVDGIYTVTVTIADTTATMDIEIVNDQSPPMLSNTNVLPDVVAADSVITLSVNVTSNVPNAELSVTADVSEIDADAAAVQMTMQPGTESTYVAIYVVQNDDPADDGDKSITFMASDRIGGESEMSVSIALKNDVTPPALSDAAAMPSPVVNGMDVTISVSSESGIMVTADASAIGGDAAAELTEGMDENMAGTGMYSSAPITVDVDAAGNQTVTIMAVDGSGNEATADVTVMVEVHEVTSVTFSPAEVGTGGTVMVTAMGTAGLTAMFNVFDAEGMNIVDGKALDESADAAGTYMGSFTVVVDAHPAGEYWVSASVGTSDSMTADGSLTIDHEKHFTLSIGAGTHAIHIPLDVEGIDTVGDVYDALGDSVRFIIAFVDGTPMAYLGDENAGGMADATIGDDTGLIAVMASAATLELTGQALGTGGVSQININPGSNLVGVPLDPTEDMMISDALVEGVAAIAVSNANGDGFHTITAAGDMGDGPVMGGVGYVVVYTGTEAASIPIVGSAWENDGAAAAAPAVVFRGTQTPVLHVDGGIMDEYDMLSRIPELRVTVKNLSTGASLDTVAGTESLAKAYSGTFVELSRHAAKVGDVLEIIAHSPNPMVGVRPVPQIVVSAEEVLTSRLELPDLELYEIPSETELLANFPNPFNPETWIPYRLAKAAKVTLEIYDTNGRLVRSIDVGFKPAAVYESRASAIYWDGRNNYGERVASGTYFYHLTAGDDYASTRRMVILK